MELYLNIKKTKIMTITNEEFHKKINNDETEVINSFTFLESLIIRSGGSTAEIKYQVALGHGKNECVGVGDDEELSGPDLQSRLDPDFMVRSYGQIPVPQYYKYLLTFRFAIEEINQDQTILPNVSLGYHIYDSCADNKKAVKSVLQILSGPRTTVPNYSCTRWRNVAGFIGDHGSSTTVSMAQILALYRHSQISYGATSYVLNDRSHYPSFYRTIESLQRSYMMLSKMIRFFRWTWVGILLTDNESGDEEIHVLTQYLTMNGVCVAYTIKVKFVNLNVLDDVERKNMEMIRKSSARVIMLCGTYSPYLAERFQTIKDVLHDKTLVFGPSFAVLRFIMEHHKEIFNGSLALEPSALPLPDMRSFYQRFRTISHPEDMLLAHIWFVNLRCLSKHLRFNTYHQLVYKKSLHNCTGTERVTDFYSFQSRGLSDRVYKAVWLLAQALNALMARRSTEKTSLLQRHTQLHRYLGNQRDDSGNPYFNRNGDFIDRYSAVNWIAFSNGSQTFQYVGHTETEPQTFIIDVKSILWKTSNNQVPDSLCSDHCLPGTRKVSNSKIFSCCYNCVQCSPGEISNTTDSETCVKCSDLDWPNEKKDRCVPKLQEFLSYTDDTIVLVISLVSTIFSSLTFTILVTFILHQNSAIVKANNRSLSFLLLVSIMLSFLCVFLFLGRPVDLTCVLRQVSFGILFSVAVSCILAKTFMVCIAFKATKPGSSWKRWIGGKWSNSLVLFCSSIQVMICMGWLTLAPPFSELHTHSYQGKITVQCNEGSVIGFYSILGYMGVLASVSFITAFFARTLPDSFNEAKYITFSMLVFCSVWIAMIPVYLSTKGKYMVAVEIFAILTSSAGLLGCIFFPKCYIILWRPELNSRTHLLGRSNSVLSYDAIKYDCSKLPIFSSLEHAWSFFIYQGLVLRYTLTDPLEILTTATEGDLVSEIGIDKKTAIGKPDMIDVRETDILGDEGRDMIMDLGDSLDFARKHENHEKKINQVTFVKPEKKSYQKPMSPPRNEIYEIRRRFHICYKPYQMSQTSISSQKS
ncbi:vomeronasal type-2 receptor 26-like [Phyllobates terribilis]|uniref:vomeronasal type-2 receptor 26-like n=1 Tax=Phyllobates terribilis TaxID=111132 RepID=UPI003CCABF6B